MAIFLKNYQPAPKESYDDLLKRRDEHIAFAKLRMSSDDNFPESKYGLIYNHTQIGLYDYYVYRYRPGGFLGAVLGGAPTEFCLGLADERNRVTLDNIRSWIKDNLPEESFGSPEKIVKWCSYDLD
jgi:hypothetical protein